MELPKEFVDYTSSLFGEERWKNYLASFEESGPVSVRLNPFKYRPTRPLPPSLGVVTPTIFLNVQTSRLIHYSMPEYIMFKKQEVCFLTRY